MSNHPWPQRLAALQPTAINRVLQEVRQLQAEGRDLVSLMRGEPTIGTPSPIKDAATRALVEGLTCYADQRGEPVLRRAVAEKLRRDNGLTYDPDCEILITGGATEGLFTALGALVEPDDEVLLPDPIYDAYRSPIAIWGARAIPVRSVIRDGRFALDRAALESAQTARTRVLLLNTPWNPTGTVFTHDELKSYMGFAANADLHVISDEIYENLVYDGRRHASPATISADARKRTIVVNSLSKTYAMTGWRVGYCAAPADIIQTMLLVLQQFSRGPATFVQHAAAHALTTDQAPARRMRSIFQAGRDRTVQALHGIPGVTPLVPEGGLFVMVDIRGLGRSSEEVRRFLLHEAGVIVIHGAAYGEAGEGTLRVSFASHTDPGDPQPGLNRLRRGLERLSITR